MKDHGLLHSREIDGESLVERIASLVILVCRLDGAGLPRFQRLPGPFDIRASAGRNDIVDDHGGRGNILSLEYGSDRSVGNHDVTEIVDRTVKPDNASEDIVLAASLRACLERKNCQHGCERCYDCSESHVYCLKLADANTFP